MLVNNDGLIQIPTFPQCSKIFLTTDKTIVSDKKLKSYIYFIPMVTI